MFYAHFVLAKKGPLARIWLAAHWDKKLTKAHIFETNIESSVEGILHPKIKMALRTSGHLLLGVVRIYSRKAKYLLADCNEAFIKIKMAFRPGIVDLPEGNREAAVATITLPEVFHDFDTVIPDISIDLDTPTTLNQSRAEDITLKEDYGTLSLMADDGFGDMAFDDPEMARDATNIDEGFDHASLLLVDDKAAEPNETPQNTENVPEQAATPDNTKNMEVSLDPVKDNGFDGAENGELLDENANGLFESAGLFDDAPLGNVPIENRAAEETAENQPTAVPEEQQQKQAEVSDDDDDDYGPPSVGLPSAPTSPESVAGDQVNIVNEDVNNIVQAAEDVIVPPPPVVPPPEFQPEPQIEPPQNNFNQNFLNHSEETFALAPLEALLYQGTERSKAKRKRKLIIDEVKNISGEEMKAQLADTTDIVTTLDLAPPTKRLMQWKETGGVEKLFALPGHIILSRTLARLYQRHLTTRPTENELFGTDEDAVQLGEEPEKPRDEPSTMQLRKRRRVQGPDFSDQISDMFSMHPEISASHIEQEVYNPPAPLRVSTEEPVSASTGLLIPPPPPESEDTILLPEHVPLPEELPAHNETSEIPAVPPPEESEATQIVLESVPEVQESAQVNEPPPPPEPVAEVNQETETDVNQEAEKDVNDNTVQQEKPLIIDDDEDYAAPASIGPMLPEEQMADETYEQFEERILSKRTTHMLHVIKRCLERGTKVPFSALAREKKRKMVAQKFYTFLVLKKQQAVELEQSESYGEIYISSGPNFDSIYQ